MHFIAFQAPPGFESGADAEIDLPESENRWAAIAPGFIRIRDPAGTNVIFLMNFPSETRSTARHRGQGLARGLAGTLAFLAALLLSACITVPKPTKYDQLTKGHSEGHLVYLSHADLALFRIVGVRSVVLGQWAGDLDSLRDVYETTTDIGFEWKVDAEASFNEALVEILPALERHVRFVSARHDERDWMGRFRPTIHLSLIESGRGIDHFQTDHFVSRPTLRFVLPANPDSPQSLELSLIKALGTIQHELVHFASAFGQLDVAADRDADRETNEEILAYLVSQCDELAMMSNFHNGSARVSLRAPEQSFSRDPEKALDFARSASLAVGPSVEANVIADWFFTGSAASPHEPLSDADHERFALRCADWTTTGRDFMSIYRSVVSLMSLARTINYGLPLSRD